MTLFPKYIPLLLVLIFIIVNRFAANCVLSITCPAADLIWPFFFELIKPLYLYSLVFGIVSVCLVFVNKQTFGSWLKLAVWWIPLSVILIAVTPKNSSSWMPLYFVGKDTVTLIMASLFAVISLALIGWKTFVSRKKN